MTLVFCSLMCNNLFGAEICISFSTTMLEECFFLGEKSKHMLNVTPFNGNLQVHIKQFYVN